MKITKYKRGGEPRHVIEYKDAPGRIAIGSSAPKKTLPTDSRGSGAIFGASARASTGRRE
jgi:hypothetical protein